jgi:hypothetical protein
MTWVTPRSQLLRVPARMQAVDQRRMPPGRRRVRKLRFFMEEAAA